MTFAVCYTITQHNTDGTMCSRLCPYNIGDTKGGIEDQEQFCQRLDNSGNEGTQRFLPKKSSHLQNEGETDQDEGRETLTLCSE